MQEAWATDAAGSADLLEVDLNENRRKRQKTNSPEGRSGLKNVRKEQGADMNAGSQSRQISKTQLVPEGDSQNPKPPPNSSETNDSEILVASLPGNINGSVMNDSHPLLTPGVSGDMVTATVESKPMKTMQFNSKSGTLGSPPTKPNKVVKTTARNRSTTSSKQNKTKLVIVRYTNDQLQSLNLGQKINAIMDGTRTAASFFEKVVNIPNPPKSTKIPGNGSTTAHPFFLPKATMASTSTQAIPSHEPSSSRGRPKKSLQIAPDKPKSGVALVEGPQSKDRGSRQGTPAKIANNAPRKIQPSVFSGFGNTSKIPRLPVGLEPAWPWKGMVHVRGLNNSDEKTAEDGISWIKCSPGEKKSKYHAMEVAPDENLISDLASRLSVNEVVKSIQEINLDEYPIVPPCLRAATRYFQSGPTIQKQIRKELHTSIPRARNDKEFDTVGDEIHYHDIDEKVTSTPLPKLFESLATKLSAFDQNRYETQLWTQKYAPQSAVDVLHNVPEALILKEWLQTLTLMSTENVNSKTNDRRSAPSKAESSHKRKRKSNKLDDFIVSSGEDDTIDELAEGHESPQGSQNTPMKTVVSAGRGELEKNANGVVISGPHGCGKTAAVYAVAKELGFEVFEINSSSRRSGKDILDRVGDVTRNHLVRGSHNHHPEAIDADTQRIADALDADIKSGRQGTMNTFFKAKEPTNTSPVPKIEVLNTTSTGDINTKAPPKVAQKAQKQSLIFFEEVDILYEEDKNFWNTVMAMVIESKRPIVMTCTDESVIPIASLSLHAILRFTAAPAAVAADHMLLIAANEGHMVRHDAAKALYEGRNKDLRGSVTDLNLWCQFGVGDNKGTVDWICPRWPPGIDTDEDGHTLRVVSEGAYQTGMGWICQDFLEGNETYLDVETEVIRETQDAWQIDAIDWHDSIDISGWAKSQSTLEEKKDRLAMLQMYADFTEAMSGDDVCFGRAFAPDNQRAMDASLPNMPSKAREDYPLGRDILEVEPFHGFGSESIRVEISSWIKSRSRDHFQLEQHASHGYEIPAQLDRLSEASIHKLIRNRSSKSDTLITRRDFSAAFDPISEPDTYAWKISSSLELSSFDRPLHLLVTDMAPYVRSIVSYDIRLSEERLRMSGLLSEGGQKNKRMRKTRAALSALEGGPRSTTRRERYFGPDLNPYLVLKTGSASWLKAVAQDGKNMEREQEDKQHLDIN